VLQYDDLHELLCKHADIASVCQEELDRCIEEEQARRAGSSKFGSARFGSGMVGFPRKRKSSKVAAANNDKKKDRPQVITNKKVFYIYSSPWKIVVMV
jgi:hypothetical protein